MLDPIPIDGYDSPMKPKTFAKMLNKVMKANGWTEHQAAAKLGVSQSTINRIRHGQVSRIDFVVGSKIADLYEQI